MDNQTAADNAQFEAGYSDKPTETPVEAKPETKPEAKPQDNPAEPPKAAPLGDTDHIKMLTERLDKYERTNSTLAGHIGNLTRTQRELQTAFTTAKAAGKTTDAPTQTEIKQSISNPAEWEKLKEQYPEWATAHESLLDSRIAARFDPKALDASFEQKLKGQSEAIRTEIIHTALEAVRPGWTDEVTTPEFQEWTAKQPADVQALTQSDKVSDVIKMLKLFDASKQAAAAPAAPKPDTSAREKRIAAAVNPRGTGGHAPSRSDLDEFTAGYGS